MKNITFKEAFQYNCNDPIEISPSFTESEFSSTNMDVESPKFTPSNKFTNFDDKSPIFTNSDVFPIVPSYIKTCYSSTTSEISHSSSISQAQNDESQLDPETSKNKNINQTNILLIVSITLNLVLIIIIITMIIIIFFVKKKKNNYIQNNASESLYDSFIN